MLLLILAGIILLLLGGDQLVRGASRLAETVGLPPLVIGLTVVAFGTSAPEFAVSLQAAVSGQASVSLGNVVGSNTFNVLVVLGASALIAPLAVSLRVIRLDVPLMIAASLLTWILALNGYLGRLEGAVLVIALVVWTFWLVRAGLRQDVKYSGPDSDIVRPRFNWISPLQLIAGIGLLVLGSRWLVNGAVAIARHWGVSELVIGLTIVAAGTSLPELVTSIMAALKGERDIAVGNVLGSNLFNIFGVLGASAALAPKGLEISQNAIQLDLPVMIGAAMVCLPIFFTGYRISRGEGAVLLVWYLAYMAWIVVAAAGDHVARTGLVSFYGFLFPLTLLGLALSVVVVVHRNWRKRRN